MKCIAGSLKEMLLSIIQKIVEHPEKYLCKDFTVYEDIHQKLIAQGMPASQIAFIHEANTEVRKKELFFRGYYS